MQDRYVGDAGDFGKYGLLRSLLGTRTGEPPLSLGVVWYLVPDDGNGGDGTKVGYLNLPSDRATFFRDCDPALYDGLQGLVSTGCRSTQHVKDSAVLPAGTVFFAERLAFSSARRNGEARQTHRAKWIEAACRATAGCDLVFLDPDNGLGGAVLPHNKAGVKYAYLEEVRRYLERSQSIVVYHHIGRQGTAREQVSRQLRRLTDSPEQNRTFAMLFHRGTARAFLVVESKRHRGLLFDRARRMMEGPWCRHFELVLDERCS
jgi:hypothetical protein